MRNALSDHPHWVGFVLPHTSPGRSLWMSLCRCATDVVDGNSAVADAVYHRRRSQATHSTSGTAAPLPTPA